MKKFIKMAVFTLIYIVLPLALNVTMLQLIKNIEPINKMRETTPTSAFLILDPISILGLFLLVKFIRRENPIKFASIKSITSSNALICAGLGLVMAMFTNSLLNIDSFKKSVESITGSIDWIIGGNIVLVVIVTLINSTYKEFCFRGLAFNEMRLNLNFIIALVIQAMFYAGELVYFQNPVPAILYAFLGQLVFGIIFYLGGSMWSSFITQVCCTMGLVLFRRTGLSSLFNNASATVLFILSIAAIFVMIIVLYRNGKSHKSTKVIKQGV